ncbi:mandelate racemase/muconate lactonizing enzyme family protein [Candidatus Latescibacterota bacterium]
MKNKYCNRKDFLKTAGMVSLAALGTGLLPSKTLLAIDNIEPMKITKIELLTFSKKLRLYGLGIPWTWVRLHTESGLTGIGESYPRVESQSGALKDFASMIIGSDARNIERLWRDMYGRASFTVTGGAEMRIISAVNTAQWDILGKVVGAPVYTLLGGRAQDKIRVYDTYTSGWTIDDLQLDTDAEKITRTLLDRGIKAIKIVPYDNVARKNNGSYISPAEIEECLDWVKRIRDTAGNEMEIAIEGHSYWNLPCALKIAKSLEPYNVMWLEDIMQPDNMQSYATLARETSIPICNSERLATRYGFREMLEAKAVDIAMYDLSWCGGVTSAKKIADYADTYYIPIAPHKGNGPINWFASMHVATSATNLFIHESSWGFYTYVFPHFIKNVPVPENGFVTPPELPGLGIDFREEPFENGDIIIETIAEI